MFYRKAVLASTVVAAFAAGCTPPMRAPVADATVSSDWPGYNRTLAGQLYALDASTGRVLWQTSVGQSTGGGIITYIAGGRQLLGIASGMKSVLWPGGAAQSRVVVYGLR